MIAAATPQRAYKKVCFIYESFTALYRAKLRINKRFAKKNIACRSSFSAKGLRADVAVRRMIGKKDLEIRKFLAIFALQTQWGSDPRGSGFLFFMFFKYG